MRLAMIQLRASNLSNYERTARHIEEMIRRAAKEKPDLILLPECAYPAYMLPFDERNREAALSKLPEIEATLSNLAAEYRVYLVAGLPHRLEGALYNAAVAYGPDGAMIAWAAKRNLWHFDADSFSPGCRPCVFDTPFGRIGMMVCADGRIPEIMRELRLLGAGLVLDTVNLVANAQTPQGLENQQHAFMLCCRARENGVCLAVCNKCGVEEGIVTYLGRSFVAGKDGRILTECGPDEETILLCETGELSPSPGEEENVLCRIPNRYLPLSAAVRCEPEKGRLLYAMLARFDAASESDYLCHARHFLAGAALIKAQLVLLPWWEGELDVLDRAQLVQHLPSKGKLVLAGRQNGGRRAELWGASGCEGVLIEPEDQNNAPQPVPVLKSDEGLTLAVCFDSQPWTPEFVRTQAIQGADVSIWYTQSAYPEQLLRTRAAENRIYVVQMARRASCSIFGPDSGMLVSTYANRDHAAAAYIDTKFSRNKEVVPGTNVFPCTVSK